MGDPFQEGRGRTPQDDLKRDAGQQRAASLEEIQSNLDSLLTDKLERITKVFEHTEKRFT